MIAKVSTYGASGVAADVRVSSDVSGSSYAAADFTKPPKRARKESTPKAPIVLEKRVKEQVRRVLKSLGVWYCTPIGSGFGAIAHDFIACVPVTTDTGVQYGQFVSIETKSTNGVLRPRQIAAAKSMQDAVGVVFVVYPGDVSKLKPAIQAIMAGRLPLRGE